MSERLPNGWIETYLADVCTHPQYGWTSSATSNGKIRLLRTTDISNGKINWKKVPYCETESADLNKFLINENDILVSRAGSVGISYRIKKGDLLHQTVFASYLIRFCPLVLPASFIEYFLKSHQYWSFISDSQLGIAVPNVNATKLSQLPILLPPLNEQKRIVAKLDAIMPRIEAVKARLEKVPVILKRFRQSVLTAAVTGKLTEKWRKEHPEVGEWREKKLGDILDSGPQNGLYKSQDFYGSGVLILRIDNFYNGLINSWDSLKRLVVSESEKDTYELNNGDIVINRVNSMPFLGKSALVRNLNEICVFESNMMRIKVDKKAVNPEFLIRYLNCHHGLAELRKNAKHAVNQSSINQQDVKAVICPLPPLEEQKEIVRQVDKLFALADKVEAHYQQAQARVDKLAQSVLAKAFRGELVPQDPNDEPAEKLLERVLAEKAKMENEKKMISRSARRTQRKK
ncbi:restriction endonuclease subunit S [candidate division KSB1 bacterium]|nr:restriction endonuclease subunit S [candidate division KSB1 bacterium]